MTENDFGAQYQPCRFCTFLGFYSDYHPDLYGDMAITLQPETVDKKKVGAKENDSRPCRIYTPHTDSNREVKCEGLTYKATKRGA